MGTHAVFQDEVRFARPCDWPSWTNSTGSAWPNACGLSTKGQATDVLVMTATPIPRTLSLAQYGDMDVSVLDEKPPGRKPVKTALLSTARIGEVVSHLRDALAKGRQAYWVCPLVEESEVYDAVAAEERFAHLRAELGEGKVGLVHGRLTPSEKAAVMAAFQEGRVQVLVATTVIEVGVDVPNASIMVIEQADLFGLSQLHQLRGRVGAWLGRIDLPAALPFAAGRDGEAAADGAARDRGRVSHRRGGSCDSRGGGSDRNGAVRAAAVPHRRSRVADPAHGAGAVGRARAS